jgi:lipoprotein-anchoring transpeptidase ErfK/SrfK
VAQWVFDVSTGRVAGTTPRGEWNTYRAYDGYEHGPLGVLYRPRYVVGGVAVHGYPSVPAYPASHGCIRVINPAMDFLWDTDALSLGTTVVIY